MVKPFILRLAVGVLLAIGAGSILLPTSLFAQQAVSPCVRNAAGGCVPVTASAPLPVTGAGGGGTASAFGDPFPASGTAVGMSDGTDMVPLFSSDGTALDVAIPNPVVVTTNDAFPLAVRSVTTNDFNNITTDGDQGIFGGGPGVFVGLSVNTPGTASSVTVYDNEAVEGSCTGNVIGIYATTTQGALLGFNIGTANGLCVETASTLGPADITIIYR